MIVVSVYVGQIDGQIDCVTPATHESVLAKSYPTRYSNQILGSSPRTTEITTQHDERVMPERSFVVNFAHSGNFRVFNLNPWDEITRQKSIKLVLFARGVDLGRRVNERERARERECAREREREREVRSGPQLSERVGQDLGRTFRWSNLRRANASRADRFFPSLRPAKPRSLVPAPRNPLTEPLSAKACALPLAPPISAPGKPLHHLTINLTIDLTINFTLNWV